MSTVVIVYQNRTAVVAACWLLRRVLTGTYNKVITTTIDNHPKLDHLAGSDVIYLAEMPNRPLLQRVLNAANAVKYIAMVRTNALKGLNKWVTEYPKFSFAVEHEGNIVETVIKQYAIDDLPPIIQWLAQRMRSQGAEQNTLTDYLYNAMAVVDDPLNVIDGCADKEMSAAHNLHNLQWAGELLERRHNENIAKLIVDHTFELQLKGLEGTVSAVMATKYLASSAARAMADVHGFGISFYDSPDGYRYFEAVKKEGYPLDILAIAKQYKGIGRALFCKFRVKIPVLQV